MRKWVLQNWSVDASRPESQLLLAWFRRAEVHWGAIARLVITPCCIVRSPHCALGGDCHLRQGVTIGSKGESADNEIGVPHVGDSVFHLV
jgi:serine acetyltransferase